MSGPIDGGGGGVFPRPRPLAVLAVVESVAYGLTARHAFDEVLPTGETLTLTFVFLVPALVGYRSVALSDERRVGVMTPSALLLMLLAAAVAEGGAGVLCTLLLMPVFWLMALLGGTLALVVRGTRRAAPRIAERLAGAARSLRGGRFASRTVLPRAEWDHARPGAEGRDAWQQVIIRTPF